MNESLNRKKRDGFVHNVSPNHAFSVKSYSDAQSNFPYIELRILLLNITALYQLAPLIAD